MISLWTPVVWVCAGVYSIMTGSMETPITQPTKWTKRLAFDVALMLEGSGEPLDAILRKNGLSTTDLLKLSVDPLYSKQVDAYRKEIRTNGITFKLKAQSQAEILLDTSFDLIHSPAVAPAVKADLIKATVKWAGMEGRAESSDTSAGGGVKITINLAGQDVQTQLVEEPQSRILELEADEIL